VSGFADTSLFHQFSELHQSIGVEGQCEKPAHWHVLTLSNVVEWNGWKKGWGKENKVPNPVNCLIKIYKSTGHILKKIIPEQYGSSRHHGNRTGLALP